MKLKGNNRVHRKLQLLRGLTINGSSVPDQRAIAMFILHTPIVRHAISTLYNQKIGELRLELLRSRTQSYLSSF